ncbi:MAG: hypothetical protein ABI447_29340 [Pseudomonas sp.]
MNQITNDFPESIRRQAESVLCEIDSAGSMIVAVKKGARANGFVLGIMCSGGLRSERCETLSAHFDQAREKRLKLQALGT